MWELGNIWAEGNKSAAVPMGSSSYLSIMYEIQVLLVDHESESLINTAKMLEFCQYRVTIVELASAAIKMLLSGKAKFDLVIANINSPDLHGFKLLQQTVNMGIPIILMSTDDNTFVAMRAIESGATLYIQKPVTMEIIKCIWQFVLKDKKRAMKERENVLAAASYNTRTGIEFREVMHDGIHEPNPNIGIGGNNNIMIMDENGKLKRKGRGRKDDGYDSDLPNRVRRKVCTEWTQELHEKFMAAVEQLGEGRCFPKEILDLMDVPGLTRMQVASHLQKCRNDNWRSPEERKSNSVSLQQPAASDASDGDGGANPKPRRFGSMPRSTLGKADSGPQGEVQGGNNNGGPGSTQSQTNNGNMVSENDNVIAPIHQHYENLMPMNPAANPRHQSADDFFNFPEMDCLIQNFHQGTSASMMVGNPNYAGGFHPFHEQNHWNTDQTSTFGGDDGSETRGH